MNKNKKKDENTSHLSFCPLPKRKPAMNIKSSLQFRVQQMSGCFGGHGGKK